MYDAIYWLHWIINALIILAVCVCAAATEFNPTLVITNKNRQIEK